MAIKITINGVDYPSVEAMPPDVRKTFEEVRARFPNVRIGEDPSVKKNELKVTFQLNGPHLRVGRSAGDLLRPGPNPLDPSPASESANLLSMGKPIEPTGFGLPWALRSCSHGGGCRFIRAAVPSSFLFASAGPG
jgi:hypothetical protein